MYPVAPYILYGDGDSLYQTTLTEIMNSVNSDINVICKPNGIEIIKFLDNLPYMAHFPSCLILDVNMPLWDGICTIHTVKNNHKYFHIPCFLFSDFADGPTDSLARLTSAEKFIEKPFGQHLYQICEVLCNYCYKPAVFKKQETL